MAGAVSIPFGTLPRRITELPQDRMILIYCASGTRSQIAASLLIKHGLKSFASLQGGLDAWKQAGLPLTAGT